MVHLMQVPLCFLQLSIKNSESSFSVDNMPVHALDVFIENATEK